MLALLSIFFLLHPNNSTVTIEKVYVDTIEINHMYNEYGLEYFDQIILWREYSRKELNNRENVESPQSFEAYQRLCLHWKVRHLTKHVVDWKTLKRDIYRRPLTKKEQKILESYLDRIGVTWFSEHIGIWIGGPLIPHKYSDGTYRTTIHLNKKKLLQIIAKNYVETQTHYDPEMLDRACWPRTVRDREVFENK